MQQVATSKDIFNLPKVELHLHLEGSITPHRWLEFIYKNNPTAQETLATIYQKLEFLSFHDFLLSFKQVIDSLKDPEDFYWLTKDLLQSKAKQNVMYCEVFFSPWFFVQKSIEYKPMIEAIDKAAKEEEHLSGIQMKLLFDGPRNFGNKAVLETFQLAEKDSTGRVIGVGIGGDEINFPARNFVKEFAYAKAVGFNLVAHAGEGGGEQSMKDAIEQLNVTRIGHCLGIKENSELEKIILEKNITLELCPWSNVKTNVISKLEEHPFPRYFKKKYPVTLNTDDPGMFQVSLNEEFERMHQRVHFSKEDLILLSKNAILGSFLDKTVKIKLLNKLIKFQDS